MQPRIEQIRACLQAFDFKKLFIQELGWDKHSTNLPVAVDGKVFNLHAIAEKRGMQVFELVAPGTEFPDYDGRRKIERQVAKLAHEHIIIYTDADKTVQKWQWVRREAGRPLACREPSFEKGQSGEGLVQKLQILAVALDEEEKLSLVEVTGKAKKAFDVDRVTKRFYDRFKTEHTNFLSFIKGITEKADREWYASLMLNRLMFIYFIQKKGFLDGDMDYLRNRLHTIQERKGKDKFLTFYQYFLLRLFHEGLGKPKAERNWKKDLESLIGEVPYLNGGLFDVHQLERANPEIQINDDAFERLFDFFDAYEWHLDDRPLHKDNQINPDVLGYIFEKYINQKQMGAYYTKEDITGYIARNTIIPFLFNAAEKDCDIAFRPESVVWRLLSDDPNRYIYPAVGHSIFCDANQTPARPLVRANPLPPAVVEGISDISKRKGWNGPTTPEFGLPTETWREVVTRRERCEELQRKLKAGEVHNINDLITLNLDICQFAEDVIANCEGSELLLAFWKAIQNVSVLDPTCGSGAFLFASLNILEPLYEACLERMRGFVEDLERSKRKHHHATFEAFRKVLQEADDTRRHPKLRYFVLKSIILNNLYGVDIMEEAVEICKLRLFLNLVAQVETAQQVEPLPDIDFNIRAGNTLVGFATLDEVKRSLLKPVNKSEAYAAMPGMGESEEVDEIVRAAKYADDAFRMFHEIQTVMGLSGSGLTKAKQDLRQKLDTLNAKLDHYLAGENGIDPKKPAAFAKWKASHQPFHWFAEFYGIMNAGGFDVIIGNPPYIEYSKVKRNYVVLNARTLSCGNLYAICIERSYQLLASGSRFGFIVQAPLVSTQRMAPVRRVLKNQSDFLSYATFDDRPSKLFDGMHHCRLAIPLARKATAGNDSAAQVGTTRYYKWYDVERPFLFETLQYFAVPQTDIIDGGLIPKFRSQIEFDIFKKVNKQPSHIGELFSDAASKHQLYYKITGVGHWFTFTTRPPRFWRDGVQGSSTRESSVAFSSALCRDTAFCCLWSTLHYWLYQARTNCRDFNPSDVEYLPIPKLFLDGVPKLGTLAEEITKVLEDSSTTAGADYEVGGSVTYERFKPKLAKSLFDKADAVLAKHYGFTDEELDFIINYDIKYRLGQDTNAEEDE